MSSPPAAQDPVARLYAIAPEEFVAARKELAAQLKAVGHRDEAAAVLALRKPTAAAWAVNLLAAADPDAVSRLAALGDDLRAAQERLDGAALRELGTRRRSLVAELTRAAVVAATDAGRPPSGAVREQIEQTLVAAVADAETAQRVRTARLVSAGEVAPGLGPVALPEHVPDAVAPGPVASVTPIRSRSKRSVTDDDRAAREEAARAAHRELIAKAEAALAAATDEARAAAGELDEAERTHADAEAALAAARATLDDAEHTFTDARRARQQASTRARRAADALAAATKRREALGE